jgi:thiosulfate/3-mercaptopyruvate sulfurtransferase
MPYKTLISAAQLQAEFIAGTPLLVLDCGFDLSDTGAGERAYAAAHLPLARYVHLDRDLSAPKTGRNGRHPLPSRDVWAGRVGEWGIAPGTTVVCYDDQGGVYAARAWWMLKWLGHSAVAVLDGGRAAWMAQGGAMVTTPANAAAQPPYPAQAAGMPTVEADELLARLGELTVLDARAPERFRGEVEPLDPVAGHIPGATCHFFKDNLAADGRFKSAAELRASFARWSEAGEVVHQCGSGVTACHNLLAMAHAGLKPGTLYGGSWSEWCSDPARPVAKG